MTVGLISVIPEKLLIGDPKAAEGQGSPGKPGGECKRRYFSIMKRWKCANPIIASIEYNTTWYGW